MNRDTTITLQCGRVDGPSYWVRIDELTVSTYHVQLIQFLLN
jgi:hypothetical protein